MTALESLPGPDELEAHMRDLLVGVDAHGNQARKSRAAENAAILAASKPWIAFELGCVGCGGQLALCATNNPERRTAVAALQCSVCHRYHALRVQLDVVPQEGKLL